VNINPTTVYYLLSSAAQVYAALIAVFGALAVYRLTISSQFRRDTRERIARSIRQVHEFHGGTPSFGLPPTVAHLSTKQLNNLLKGLTKEEKQELTNLAPVPYDIICYGQRDLDASIRHSKSIRWITGILTGFFLIFIAGSLYGLLYISYWLSDRSFLVHLTEFALAVTFIIAGVHFWIVFREEPRENGGDK
jgi:hypothetical protein